MLFIGGLASIPGYKWFLFLGSHWNYPQSKLLSISVKVVIQQFVFAPVFNTYFFGMQAALSGEPPSVVLHRIANAVPESVISSAKFWPAVTAINFTFVPAAFRFMFSGVFAVVWQTYLSFLNRRAEVEGPSGTLAEQGRLELFEASVAEKVEEVVEDVKEKVEDVVEKGKEVAEDVVEKGKEVMEDVAERGKEVAEDVIEESKKMIGSQEALKSRRGDIGTNGTEQKRLLEEEHTGQKGQVKRP